MTALRPWQWDLDEMKEAAIVNETLEYPGPALTVSGFTPINNRGYDTAPIHPEHKTAATKSTAADKPKAPKRRKTQSSAAKVASKPKRATSSKKTKGAKTAAQLDCQDISHGLSRTKPTSSGFETLGMKATSSLGDVSLEQGAKLQGNDVTPVALEVTTARGKQREPSGLAAKYQAAYPNTRDNNVNQATRSTPPTSGEAEAKLDQTYHSHVQDLATERQASPNIDVEPFIQENPKSDDSVTVRDFGVAPFTQTSHLLQYPNVQETMMVEDFDPVDSMLDDFFETGDIEHGDDDGEDEFPVDDDYLEEMMQSMAVPAEEETLGTDWPPQDFSDDTLCMDEQPENDQIHWLGTVQDSDGLVMHDEDPTLVVGDIVDGPPLAHWSSQGSCILTQVTGNANPALAKTSEGSENCFDDNDLDDSLVGFRVDDSKSFQATSLVTPAKRPSPKLQWLSPKTYTPAKLSQIPVSPADKPHTVPTTSNNDILPFVRPPFPQRALDRSPIGLNNRVVLRTCFRIGEGLNAATLASRENIDAIIELYARVATSSREVGGGYKQFFQFADLFTDKPPYLSGIYTLWKGVPLWDNDSKGLVGEQGKGKMVRVMGRIKKKLPVQGQGPRVEMVVLSIWEVDREDVEVAKGIVCFKGS